MLENANMIAANVEIGIVNITNVKEKGKNNLMNDLDRTFLYQTLYGLLHQYESEYDESLRFIHRYGKPFPSDYAAVSLALSKVETLNEVISRLSLMLDTLDHN